MTTEQKTLLQKLAPRYIWWKSSEESLRYPGRIVTQVMNLGAYEDVQELVAAFSQDFLRTVLATAEAGSFNARSWNYWQVILNHHDHNTVPAPPARSVE